MERRFSTILVAFPLPTLLGGVLLTFPAVALSQYYQTPYYQSQSGYVLGASTIGVQCEFQRNLGVGSVGEDVRCLQQYLNASGFLVASSGAGSPGSETNYFGPLTARAVSRWQQAQGIFPANGFFDDLTRAKYNSFGGFGGGGLVLGAYTDISGGGYPYSTPYYYTPGYTAPNYYYQPIMPAPWYGGPVTGALLVSPGAQPPSSLALQGARIPFTRIQLSANPYRDVSVSSITVERRGFSSDAAFNSISLLDENNVEIGTSRTLNANHQAIFNTPFTVRAGTTKTITVAGNMASNLSSYVGQTASLAVISVYSSDVPIQGQLPIEGNQMTMNASFQVGNVQVRVGSVGTSAATRDIGTYQYPFSSFLITAGASEDVRLESVRWYQAGSAASSDLSNVVAVVDGMSYSSSLSADGRYYTVNFGGGVFIPRGAAKEVIIRGDIRSGSGRTVKFDIEQATDIRITSSQYSFGIVPTASSVSSPSPSTAEFTSGFPFFDGAAVTISGAAFRVARSTGTIPQFVGVGVPNQTIAKFQFSSGAEAVTIQRMVFDITILRAPGSSAGADDIRFVSLVDQFGSTLAGPFDVVGSGTNGTVTFSSSVSIPQGEHDYFLKATLGSDFREGDRITVSVEPEFDFTSIRGENTGTIITATPAGTVTSYPVTIRGTTLTVSVGSTPVSQTIVAGAQDFLFATFVFDATASGEDVRLQTLLVRYAASQNPDRTTGCQLFDNGFALNTGGNVVNPSSSSGTGGDLSFFLDSGFVIPRGSFKTVSLRCDVSGSAVPGTTYRFGLQTAPIVIGVSSGVARAAIVAVDFGPTMTVAGGGAFTVTLSPASPPYKIAVANTTEVAAIYAVRAMSESIQLTQIRLKLSGTAVQSSPADIRGITLRDANGMLLGQGNFTGTNRTVTIPLSGNFTVPKDGERNLFVYVDLAEVGINQPGTEGAHIQINYDGGTPTDTKGVGLSSGTEVTSSSIADTAVLGLRLMNTVPAVAKLAVDTGTLVAGEQKLLRWSVAANSAADVGIYKFTLRITHTSASVSNVNIYAFSDPGFSIPVSAAASDGRLDNTGKSVADDGIVEIIAENSSGFPNPMQVPKGFTRYFEARGIVSGVQSGSSVITLLEGDGAYPAFGALMGTAAQVDADIENDFLWSPNAKGTSATTDSDWTNGYGVPGLPAAGILQVLTR